MNWKISLRLLSILILASTIIQAQTWVTVGNPGFSAGMANSTSMAIDPDGTPYVLYQDTMNGYKATVMKYNGSSWVSVGSPGFSGAAIDDPSMAIDRNGTPYVAYQNNDGLHSGATVMKFNGSNWEYVGSPGFSFGFVRYTSIAISSDGTPYVAYQDPSHWSMATVMKFNGTDWVPVGTPGFSNNWQVQSTAIAIAEDGSPYVIYRDYDNHFSGSATVMKFNGSYWVVVGSRGFSGDIARYPSITTKGNVPYVVYQDLGNLGKATVMTFDGTGWVPLGGAGFTAGIAYYTTIAIAPNGTPYIAYANVTNTTGKGPATVMKYQDNNWVIVGSADFSAGVATNTSIAIDSTGIPYVAYTDNANSYKATVMKLGANTRVNDLANNYSSMIYPSPTTSFLTISAPEKITNIAITSLIGQTVYTGHYNTRQVNVDVSGLPAGLYLVILNGTEVRKFVKE